jgi:16S rRNA (cytidine1402-2'-O)-methyltransferase
MCGYRKGNVEKMAGKLYLCATPIGNLEDITYRVVRTLNEVDLIAAEDTRNSIKLLNHFEIKTPMTSYHEYNKVEKARELVQKMQGGMNIALITDAGTPGISDPGEELVRQCATAGVEVTSLPGAAACITALTLSALSTRRFCFEAFLPQDDKNQRRRILEDLKTESRTIILYEAPHHLKKTLEELYETLGDRKMALCRELTKRYEEVLHSSLKTEVERLKTEEPRGEYVIVIEGKSFSEQKKEEEAAWQEISVEEHMERYLQSGMDKKEAMKQVARDRGVSKRDIYQLLICDEK